MALTVACAAPEQESADPPSAAVDAATSTRPEAAGPASYRAVGTEPFWGLDITAAGLRFSTPENIDGTRFPPTRPATSGDTIAWRSTTSDATIEARIWPERCSDGMSDRAWTHAAAVSVDTMSYRGCADPAPGLAQALRPQGTWVVSGHRIPGVSAISNEAAARMHGRTVVFDSTRAVSDTAVCADAAYRYLTGTADSILAEFGTSRSEAGLGGTPGGFLGVTQVRCGDERWAAPGGLLLWADDEQPLTVWDGVFYELTRQRPD